MKKLSLVLTLVVLAFVTTVSSAQTTDPKQDALRTLMEKTHMKSIEMQTMTNMVTAARERPDLKDIPPELWDRFESKFDSLTTILVDSGIDIYARYFSLEDVNELIKIYDNPVMQKSMKLTPELSTEMATLGQRMGRETMQKLMEDILASDTPAENTEATDNTAKAAKPKSSKKH